MRDLLYATIRRFRRDRMAAFQRTFRLTPQTRILDVGGTRLNWSLIAARPQITLLNLASSGEATVIGDGRCLPFRDDAFDIVFSNSVIEHISTVEDQRRFADEVRRTGRAYWVQTPDRSFPIEPHLLTPFLHWLPKRARASVARRFTFWSLIERPSPDRWEFYIRHCSDEVRLLGARELQSMFPEAHIIRERFLGLSKSLIAVHAGPRT
jgi:ubiquinone/menaquinone biosynthesis C-methylase UbiE